MTLEMTKRLQCFSSQPPSCELCSLAMQKSESSLYCILNLWYARLIIIMVRNVQDPELEFTRSTRSERHLYVWSAVPSSDQFVAMAMEMVIKNNPEFLSLDSFQCLPIDWFVPSHGTSALLVGAIFWHPVGCTQGGWFGQPRAKSHHWGFCIPSSKENPDQRLHKVLACWNDRCKSFGKTIYGTVVTLMMTIHMSSLVESVMKTCEIPTASWMIWTP